MTYRIMSIDGGEADQVGAFLSLVERRGEALDRAFLGSADLFAGTSTGAVAALLFAFHADPIVALEALLRFQDEVCAQEMLGGNPLGLAGLLTGNNAAHGQGRIREFCASTFGEFATLATLRRSVLIWTFQLDSDPALPTRRWHPRAFSNLAGDLGGNELIMDVVLRTMAMPVEYPIHQSVAHLGPSFVDGAVAANNPAALTVAHALGRHKLEDIQLLSIGRPRNLCGRSTFLDPQPGDDGSANWGYRQWLLDMTNPLLLLDLFLQAGAEAASYQCRQLLGSRFHRVEPLLPDAQIWDVPDMTEVVDVVVAWLEGADWFVPGAAAPMHGSIIEPDAPLPATGPATIVLPGAAPEPQAGGLLTP